MVTKRKTLSKKIRFEVFKRDGFKCQYCGASAPESVLVVDHIDPLSKDGADEMFNYITACNPCNAGKSDRKLDDQSTLAKQKSQLDDLNLRREQLEMLMSWRKGLKEIQSHEMDEVLSAWKIIAKGYYLNDKGIESARSLLKKYGLSAVLDGLEFVEKYVEKGESGIASQESVNLAWQKLPGVLRMQSLPDDQRELHYIKGILKNRLTYVPLNVMRCLEIALNEGVSTDDMKSEAKCTRNWTSFAQWLVDARSACRG